MKAPPDGYNVVSSPNDCMIENAMTPMTPKPMIKLAGPPFERAPPLPTSRPGPIIPARANIDKCLVFRPRLTPDSGSIRWRSVSWIRAPGSDDVGESTVLGCLKSAIMGVMRLGRGCINSVEEHPQRETYLYIYGLLKCACLVLARYAATLFARSSWLQRGGDRNWPLMAPSKPKIGAIFLLIV